MQAGSAREASGVAGQPSSAGAASAGAEAAGSAAGGSGSSKAPAHHYTHQALTPFAAVSPGAAAAAFVMDDEEEAGSGSSAAVVVTGERSSGGEAVSVNPPSAAAFGARIYSELVGSDVKGGAEGRKEGLLAAGVAVEARPLF